MPKGLEIILLLIRLTSYLPDIVSALKQTWSLTDEQVRAAAAKDHQIDTDAVGAAMRYALRLQSELPK